MDEEMSQAEEEFFSLKTAVDGAALHAYVRREASSVFDTGRRGRWRFAEDPQVPVGRTALWTATKSKYVAPSRQKKIVERLRKHL